MIVQQIGSDDKRLVYVSDPDSEWKKIGADFGICDADGNPSMHGEVAHRQYTNSNGIAMPCWTLTGKTVTLYVVSDHVDHVSDPVSMAAALNYFERPMYRFGNYVFAGKFHKASESLVADSSNRSFTMNMKNLKDMEGIYGFMANIGVNNGKIFEPLVARYVTAMHVLKGTKVKAIGYFDLHEYLAIIQDHRSDLFSENSIMRTTKVAIGITGRECTVRVESIDHDTGNAILAMDGVTVMDAAKVKEFTPHVIISPSPLSIREDMTFPSTRITFRGLPLFLTPMITKPDAWTTLQGGVNLLSTRIY